MKWSLNPGNFLSGAIIKAVCYDVTDQQVEKAFNKLPNLSRRIKGFSDCLLISNSLEESYNFAIASKGMYALYKKGDEWCIATSKGAKHIGELINHIKKH